MKKSKAVRTEAEINVEIAKIIGYQWRPGYITAYGATAPMSRWHKNGMMVASLPDFCRDLNAMHEAENFLRSPEGIREYGINAFIAYKDMLIKHIGGPCATATQRAEAFLLIVLQEE